MCKEHKKEQELFEKDADRLHDLITDALDKWQESNHDDEFESTEKNEALDSKYLVLIHNLVVSS